MPTYRGSCHCGAVQFEVDTELDHMVECNCSICQKKGALHHRVEPEQFRLLSGEDALSLYQFGTHTAKHYFCRHCGIHPFGHPRLAPEKVSVNLRCLDEIDLDSLAARRIRFDGKHWEQAATQLRGRKPD